jgi:hypothetical protein
LTARDDPTGDLGTSLIIIQDEIARLPERLRAPLLLCCLQGMSYEGAARSLGLTEPALRGRLHRARKRLAAQLKGRGITAAALGSPLEPIRLPLPPVSLPQIDSTAQFSLRWSSISVLSTAALVAPSRFGTSGFATAQRGPADPKSERDSGVQRMLAGSHAQTLAYMHSLALCMSSLTPALEARSAHRFPARVRACQREDAHRVAAAGPASGGTIIRSESPCPDTRKSESRGFRRRVGGHSLDSRGRIGQRRHDHPKRKPLR